MSENVTPNDIVFECPSCHKSMVIDRAAEGASVNCPKCAVPVVVPPYAKPEEDAPEDQVDPEQLVEQVAAQNEQANQQIAQLTTSLRETAARRKFLEKERTSHLEVIKVIREELILMQQSLDRITTELSERE